MLIFKHSPADNIATVNINIVLIMKYFSSFAITNYLIKKGLSLKEISLPIKRLNDSADK